MCKAEKRYQSMLASPPPDSPLGGASEWGKHQPSWIGTNRKIACSTTIRPKEGSTGTVWEKLNKFTEKCTNVSRNIKIEQKESWFRV